MLTLFNTFDTYEGCDRTVCTLFYLFEVDPQVDVLQKGRAGHGTSSVVNVPISFCYNPLYWILLHKTLIAIFFSCTCCQKYSQELASDVHFVYVYLEDNWIQINGYELPYTDKQQNKSTKTGPYFRPIQIAILSTIGKINFKRNGCFVYMSETNNAINSI